MPGYKALPSKYSDATADHVRFAEVLQRAGDPAEAARMLEATLDDCARITPELPGWLCGRLAALYRTLGRHDDEVLLLERYADSQSSEDASNRFDARLSKARAIAERKRRTDTRALSSVRSIIHGHAVQDTPRMITPSRDDGAFAPETVGAVRQAFIDLDAGGDASAVLTPCLSALCREALDRGHPPERVVVALKTAWLGTTRPNRLADGAWEALYRDALTRTLSIYFRQVAD